MIKRLIKYSAISVLLCLVFFVIFAGRLLTWEYQDLPKTDAILVLGGGASERIDTAVHMLKSKLSPLLIISGGSYDTQNASEAEIMAHIAKTKGIKDSQMVLETNSKDTYENILYSRNILETRELASILIITSDYHQLRTYLTARKVLPQNIDVHIYGAKSPEFSPYTWWQSVDSRYFTLSEWAKIMYIFFTGEYQKSYTIRWIPKI